MLTILSRRLLWRTSFTVLFLAYLSIATVLISPVALSTSSSATKTAKNTQKLDATSSEISAATTSLQSGHGPLGVGPMSCSSGGLESAYCETVQSGQAASTPSVDGSWTNITSSSGPSPRFGASMAYDPADGYVVLFGGLNSSAAGLTFLGDTWKFSGG